MKDIIITIEMTIDETEHSNGEIASGINNDLSTIGWPGIQSVIVRDKHRHHTPPRDITGGKEGIGL